MDLFIIIAVVVGAVLWFFHARHQEKVRSAALAGWAAAKGLYFHKDRVKSFDDEHPHLRCLQRGHSRYAHNIANGEWGGLVVKTFDYHYATGSGKNRRDFDFSGVMLRPAHRLKPLIVRPEGFFDKLKAGFGFDDIDFESAEFSQKFYVAANDKSWAYDVIHTRTMHYLLSAEAKRHGLSLEFDHEVLCVYSKKQLAIDDLEYAYRHGKTVLDELPDYVKENL